MDLASSLGFSPVDCGALRYARMLEAIADLTRHLVAELGHPPTMAISAHDLPAPEHPRLGGRQASSLK